MKFVKKSGGIQYDLPASLKGGGKTRPWRSLISKFDSISKSYEALKPILKERKRDLIISIEKNLLGEILQILIRAEDIFDILEYSHVSTMQFVLPSFYTLRTFWSEAKPAYSVASCCIIFFNNVCIPVTI